MHCIEQRHTMYNAMPCKVQYNVQCDAVHCAMRCAMQCSVHEVEKEKGSNTTGVEHDQGRTRPRGRTLDAGSNSTRGRTRPRGRTSNSTRGETRRGVALDTAWNSMHAGGHLFLLSVTFVSCAFAWRLVILSLVLFGGSVCAALLNAHVSMSHSWKKTWSVSLPEWLRGWT